MKKKYICLFVIITGITFLISGGILVLTNIYRDNRARKIAQEDKIMAEIVADYKLFKEKVKEYSKDRENIYKEISEYASFYASMYTNYKDMIKKLEAYEIVVIDIDDTSSNLKVKCLDNNYRKSDVVNKCSAFITNYEQTINGFVHDIELFNSKIEEYNEWLANNEKTIEEKLKKLSLFEPTNIKEFIDINKDGKYTGKDAG